MVAPPQPILAPGGSENTRYLRRWGIHSTGSYGGTILSLTIIVLTMELEYFVFEASLVYTHPACTVFARSDAALEL